ncbi:MAG: hypothetical protein AAFV93_04505 [Chloroflexota bacterium]
MQSAHTYSWQHPFPNNRFRILFVDDNLYAVKTVRRILENAGYTVYSATNYDDALAILYQTHIHLGIFDLNLAGDDEAPDELKPQNREGLDLATHPDFPLLRMVYTGRDEHQMIVETLEHPQIATYIVKGDDSEDELLQKVETALSARLPLNQDLSFHWDGTSLQTLVQHIYPDLTLSEQLSHLFELEDLFRLQFFDLSHGQALIDHISINTLSSDKAHRIWLRISAYTHNGRRFDHLALCGARDLVLYEAQQFDQLSPRSNQMRTLPTQTLHYGLHIYDIFNQRLPHIKPLSVSATTVGHIVNMLPAITKERFQRQYHHETRTEQGALYQLALGIDEPIAHHVTERLFAIVTRLIAEWQHLIPHTHLSLEQNTIQYGIGRHRQTLVNPIMQLERFGRIEVTRPISWVHGDLRLSSIFADIDDDTLYLLDYTDAHYASALRDFVTLERSVHMSVLAMQDIDDFSTVTALLDIEQAVTPSAYATNAHALIRQIRQLALDETGCSLDDYLQDLYIDLIQTLAHYPERPYVGYRAVRQYGYCFLLAGQVVQVLRERGNDDFDADQDHHGISFDADAYIVKQWGIPAELTEQLFGIFTYLYQNLEQECTYAQIIEEGLGEQLLLADPTTDKRRIHTAMSRLRDRLEPIDFEVKTGRNGYRLIPSQADR